MKCFALVVLVSALVALVSSQSTYIIGAQGISCADACHAKGLNCNPHIVTNNSTALFQQLGISCTPDPTSWWAEDQPSYASGSGPNYGKCVGYNNVPGGVQCGAFYPTTSRLCRCDNPNSSSKVGAFGTGLSASYTDATERVLLNWIVPSGTYGVMTHFWATAFHPIIEGTLFRYYIDDESVASIQFYPPMACGVGYDDQANPWATEWFGKGAADGSWFHNFRIPFQKSIRITYQKTTPGVGGGFYTIVRGMPFAQGVSFLNLGGVVVPGTARMNLVTFQNTVQPLQWVPVVDFPSPARGVFFMHTIAVSSGNLNFLEGCYHAYTPYNQTFPGTVLSTGTEDYFDSGWYFNGGEFRFPVSGFTHLDTSNGVTWSAYRFHVMDPLPFDGGFKFLWRNGDAVDASGQKCYMETGGTIVGSPTASAVNIYAWAYTW